MANEEEKYLRTQEFGADRSEVDASEAPTTPKSTPTIAKDWSTDYFPTSARPIFVAVALLLSALVAICAMVYFTSEHREDPVELKKKKALQSTLLDEEEEDVESTVE